MNDESKQWKLSGPAETRQRAIEWGKNHPMYHVRDPIKTPWSYDEKKYIMSKYNMLMSLPNGEKNLCNNLKKTIFDDSAAWDIFHSTHVTVTKLRNGVEAFKRDYVMEDD